MRHELYIQKGHASKDHVHLLVSSPPHLSVSEIMQKIIGAFIAYAPAGISTFGQAVLGAAPMGTGLLCLVSGASHRTNDK